MLNKIDFNRLKVFYCIYQQKSLVATARTLHVTPSAVSQHLKKLEDELQLHLFTRLHKKLIPTAEATTLYTILHPFMDELRAGLQQLRNGRKEPTGTLRLGSPVEFGKVYFPQMIASYQQRCPKVSFDLRFGNAEQLLTMLKEGQLDFAMVDLFKTQKNYLDELGLYSAEPIVDEEVILACSRSYFDKHLCHPLSYDILHRQQFISYDQSRLALSGWFRHHFDKTPPRLHTILTVESVQAVQQAIENHLGLGVITCHTIQEQLERGELVAIRSGRQEIVNTISLVQLLDKIPNFTEKSFQSHIREFWASRDTAEEREEKRVSR